MAEERDDFGWLVTLLEVQKRNQRVRRGHAYTPKNGANQDFEQWRQRQRRKYLVLAIYAITLVLSIILSLVFH